MNHDASHGSGIDRRSDPATMLKAFLKRPGRAVNKIRLARLAVLLLLFGWCTPSRSANQSTVFQIGVPDGDYGEFAIARNWSDYAKEFPRDVNFVVGRSEPKKKKDWPYIQPGPADSWAGNRTHPFKIRFQMPEPVPGYYRLDVDFVSTHPSEVPSLIIEINGEPNIEANRFYHPWQLATIVRQSLDTAVIWRQSGRAGPIGASLRRRGAGRCPNRG